MKLKVVFLLSIFCIMFALMGSSDIVTPISTVKAENITNNNVLALNGIYVKPCGPNILNVKSLVDPYGIANASMRVVSRSNRYFSDCSNCAGNANAHGSQVFAQCVSQPGSNPTECSNLAAQARCNYIRVNCNDCNVLKMEQGCVN